MSEADSANTANTSPFNDRAIRSRPRFRPRELISCRGAADSPMKAALIAAENSRLPCLIFRRGTAKPAPVPDFPWSHTGWGLRRAIGGGGLRRSLRGVRAGDLPGVAPRAARDRNPQPLTAFHATVRTAREESGFKTGLRRRDKSGLERGQDGPRNLHDRAASSTTSPGCCSS